MPCWRGQQTAVSTIEKWGQRGRQSEVQDSNGDVIPYPFGTRWHLANICKLLKSTLYHLLFTLPWAWHSSVFDYATLHAWLCIHSQLDSCHLKLLPYSGKLSREKTFTNFKVCSHSRKFLCKIGGHGIFWQQHQWAICESFLHENLISANRKSFPPRKFPLCGILLT